MKYVISTAIVTLEQAGKYLVQEDVVDFETMQVEGKELLKVCGYTVTETKKKNQEIKRQINKHWFLEGVHFNSHKDVTSNSRVKPTVYQFTFNAAQHVLLAAMTDQGKAARQEAIALKEESKSPEKFLLPQTYLEALKCLVVS